MTDLIGSLRDCEYKLTCLIERFSGEDEESIGAENDACTAEELCGHWACDECGCIKDARDRAREALSAAVAAWPKE